MLLFSHIVPSQFPPLSVSVQALTLYNVTSYETLYNAVLYKLFGKYYTIH